MKKIFILFCALGLFLNISGQAKAISLQDLFDGAIIMSGDKLFADWQLISLVNTDATRDPDFSLIEVSPIDEATLEPGPGLHFEVNNQLTAVDDNFLDLTFGFSVTSLKWRRNAIKDASLTLTDYTFNGDGGVITIIETVSASTADNLVEADNLFSAFDLFSSVEFTPQQTIVVEKNILISGDFIGDFVSLDSFEQNFSQVPEPSTLLLISGGIVGFMVIRKKQKNLRN